MHEGREQPDRGATIYVLRALPTIADRIAPSTYSRPYSWTSLSKGSFRILSLWKIILSRITLCLKLCERLVRLCDRGLISKPRSTTHLLYFLLLSRVILASFPHFRPSRPPLTHPLLSSVPNPDMPGTSSSPSQQCFVAIAHASISSRFPVVIRCASVRSQRCENERMEEKKQKRDLDHRSKIRPTRANHHANDCSNDIRDRGITRRTINVTSCHVASKRVSNYANIRA